MSLRDKPENDTANVTDSAIVRGIGPTQNQHVRYRTNGDDEIDFTFNVVDLV